MNNNELVREILKMAGFDNPVEKDSGGITYHKERWGYVLGGQGELYTEELAKKWASIKRSGKTSVYFLTSAKQWYTPPRRIVDCSGLIVQAIRAINTFITTLKKQPLTVLEWNERLWITLLDIAIIRRDGSIVFRFKSGREVIA